MACARSASAVVYASDEPGGACTMPIRIALIFLRNKARGNALIDPHRGAKAGKKDQQQNVAQLQGDMNDLARRSGPAR